MTILDEFRADIIKALKDFIKRYKNPQSIPLTQKNDILKINAILEKSNDPILMRRELESYVGKIGNRLLYILIFLDVNQFRNILKDILALTKYQEISLLRSLLQERDQLISNLKNQLISHENLGEDSTISRLEKLEKNYQLQEKKTEQLEKEVGLLQRENSFLYQVISKLTDQNQLLMEERKSLMTGTHKNPVKEIPRKFSFEYDKKNLIVRRNSF